MFLLRCLGNLVSYLKLLILVLVVSGQNPAALLGLEPPQAWTRAWIWSQDNKVGLSEFRFEHSGQRLLDQDLEGLVQSPADPPGPGCGF